MQIINTLQQVRELFPDGCFDREIWRHYAAKIWPELPALCEEDASGYDFECDVLPVIEAALSNQPALDELAASFEAAVAALVKNILSLYDEEPDVTIVLYLGLCNAAGWAMRQGEHPKGGQAILLGLEKIIELGWQGEKDMKGLIFHELGHLWHESAGRRDLPEASLRERAVTQLYDEGVAMRCEQLLCGDEDFFHQDKHGWLAWCRAHADEMRMDYLKRMDSGVSTQCYFGDWARWQGQPDVGYYLGCMFAAWLEQRRSLAAVARMTFEEIDAELHDFLGQPA